MDEQKEATKITVSCPDCEKKITIVVRTIDTLREENENLARQLKWMTNERDTFKARLAAIEYMQKNPKNDFGDLFGDLFKSGPKK